LQEAFLKIKIRINNGSILQARPQKKKDKGTKREREAEEEAVREDD